MMERIKFGVRKPHSSEPPGSASVSVQRRIPLSKRPWNHEADITRQHEAWHLLDNGTPNTTRQSAHLGVPAGRMTQSNKSSGLEVWEIRQYLMSCWAGAQAGGPQGPQRWLSIYQVGPLLMVFDPSKMFKPFYTRGFKRDAFWRLTTLPGTKNTPKKHLLIPKKINKTPLNIYPNKKTPLLWPPLQNRF